ncbi:unnamed protein product [Bemisia tabaci]|uniref:Uncharacterized protein n=1 Tax=Bemisia tabaci TaxID=7038 RepID=A0A9P0F7P7_BEMTA|nr:unnamed protein product [Bemisia tabaci]
MAAFIKFCFMLLLVVCAVITQTQAASEEVKACNDICKKPIADRELCCQKQGYRAYGGCFDNDKKLKCYTKRG